jgi:hypothetical protein
MPSTIVDYLMSKKPESSILDQPYVNIYNVTATDSAWDIWLSIRGPLYQLIASVLDKNCKFIAFDLMKYIGQDPHLADTTLVGFFPSIATAEHWLALETAITNLAQEKVEDYGYHEPIRVLFRYSNKPLETLYRAKQFLDDTMGIEYDPAWLWRQ